MRLVRREQAIQFLSIETYSLALMTLTALAVLNTNFSNSVEYSKCCVV